MEIRSASDEELGCTIALQRNMLPSASQIKQIQANSPLDVSSYHFAPQGIGGDIWGIEAIGPQRIMMYVADFTGHDAAAGLHAACLRFFVQGDEAKSDKPSSLLQRLNARLGEVLPVGHFATMFCATIDFERQTMVYASAGAPPQLYRESSDSAFNILSEPSLPLGITANAAYESATVPFKAGGALVLYSDGLVETPRPPRSRLTTDSLKEFLNSTKPASSSVLCHSIVRKFFPTPELHADDDITLAIAQHSTGEATLL
jgi:sigma-B regulation protein RsbU (phosphoserine phosphatase)